MHIEFLVEDQSTKAALNNLVPRIMGREHTFDIKPYKGAGHIPRNLTPRSDPQKRILLDQLPRLLRAYGTKFSKYSDSFPSAVVVIVDLDARCFRRFREELLSLLEQCRPRPSAAFCIAIEESEAWLLGDITAVKRAYPKAKDHVMKGYENDSICGTWEKLADAVFPGGAAALGKKGWHAVGEGKNRWASHITPHMDLDKNASPSFQYFINKVKEFIGSA